MKTTSSFVTSPAVLLEGLFQTLPPTSAVRSGAPSRDAGLSENWPSAIFTTACYPPFVVLAFAVVFFFGCRGVGDGADVEDGARVGTIVM